MDNSKIQKQLNMLRLSNLMLILLFPFTQFAQTQSEALLQLDGEHFYQRKASNPFSKDDPVGRNLKIKAYGDQIEYVEYGKSVYYPDNKKFPRYFTNYTYRLNIVEGMVFLWDTGSTYSPEKKTNLRYIGFPKIKAKKNGDYYEEKLLAFWDQMEKDYEEKKKNADPNSLEFVEVKKIRVLIKDVNGSVTVGRKYTLGAEITTADGKRLKTKNIGGEIKLSELRFYSPEVEVDSKGNFTLYTLVNLTDDYTSEQQELMKTGKLKIMAATKYKEGDLFDTYFRKNHHLDMTINLNNLVSGEITSRVTVVVNSDHTAVDEELYNYSIYISSNGKEYEYQSFIGKNNTLTILGKGTTNRPKGLNVLFADHTEGKATVKFDLSGINGAADGELE